jgi:long-chain acyl-CoA synthetase
MLEQGRAARAQLDPEIDRRIAAIGRETLATIVYTSGTTGPPKGRAADARQPPRDDRGGAADQDARARATSISSSCRSRTRSRA